MYVWFHTNYITAVTVRCCNFADLKLSLNPPLPFFSVLKGPGRCQSSVWTNRWRLWQEGGINMSLVDSKQSKRFGWVTIACTIWLTKRLYAVCIFCSIVREATVLYAQHQELLIWSLIKWGYCKALTAFRTIATDVSPHITHSDDVWHHQLDAAGWTASNTTH